MNDFKNVFLIINNFITKPFYIWGYELSFLGLFLFFVVGTIFVKVLVNLFRN